MPLRDVNLLPKIERQRSGSGLLYILLIAMILISLIFFTFSYFSTKSSLKVAEEKYYQINEEFKLKEAELTSLQTDDDSNLKQSVSFVGEHTLLTSSLIIELNDLLPDNSNLIEYQYTTESVNITTHTEMLNDVAHYTADLSNSSLLTDVKVNDISTFNPDDESSSDEINFETIPRYESTYSLEVDKRQLKGDAEKDE